MVVERSPGARSGLDDARFLLYLPRVVATWGDEGPVRSVEGTLVFADVTGFTALTERLSKAGSIGSERITEAVNTVFTEILSIARLEGGDLLSFGGDALLLLFSGEDHRRRAVSAAWEMQEAMGVGEDLRASIGVASGGITLAIAGSSQRLVFVLGPVVDEVVALETVAAAGEVVVSAATLDGVDAWCRGVARAPGFVIAAAPDPSDIEVDDGDTGQVSADLGALIPAALHSELAVTGADGEHRPAVVGFVKVRGTSTSGDADAVTASLGRLVDVLVEEAGEHRVCVLASDIDRDGVKVIITAGVPHAVPEPHERLLRTVQRTIDRFPELDIRVGVADGAVFAGDLGAAFRRSYTVMGDPVNLAARLAGAAEPGELLVAPAVATHLTDRFELTARDPVSLKGKAEPVAPSVVGPPLERHTTEAVGTRLVGRRAELDEIAAIARREVDEVRMVVELVGPAGIGKSRLVGALPQALPEMAHLAVRAQEYDRSTAYRAVGTLLRRSVGIPLDATAEEAGRRLAEVVRERAPNLVAWLPLIAVAGEAKAEPTPEVDDLDPRFLTATTARLLVELAQAMLDRPAVIVVEDHEWMDPASKELIELMIDRTGEHRWLWVMTGRGGVAWPAAHRMSLGPLEPHEIEALITSVAAAMPPRLLATLVERADGNPLFAVELASLGQAESIPDTIERLIATRIDRLEARKRRLLRYASVLGNEFDLDLLAEALAPVAGGFDDSGTWSALAEFITVSPLGKVRFTQGLVREVAYAGLSYRRRQEIHGMVADTIERRARHRARRFAAVLSVHFEAAGNHEKTWEYAVAAAERAASTWATHEAVALYRRAIDAAGRLGTAADPVAACDAALALADAADLTGEFDVVEEALAYATGLQLGEKSRALAVVQARLFEKRGGLDAAAEALDQAIEGAVDDDTDMQAVMMLAGIRHRQGRFQESADHCRSVIEAPNVDEHPARLAHALNLLSLNTVHLGDGARVHAERALGLLENLGDWAATGRVLNNLAIDSYYAGRWDEAADLYRQGREASDRAGDVVMVATFDNNIAEILSDQGRLDEAAELFQRAESVWRASGYPVGEALVASNIGRLAMRQGDHATASSRLADAITRFEEMGAAALAAETRIRIVECLICQARTDEALDLLDELSRHSADRAPMLTWLRAHALAVADDDSATATMTEAVELLAGVGQPYELALARIALARLTHTEDPAAHADLAALGAVRAFVLAIDR